MVEPNRVRRGFFTREEVEKLADHLPAPHADLVRFLFWSAWRVGEARRLEWRHYFREEAVIRLPAEFSKNKQPRAIPVLGELASVIERRWKARRLDCARIFHADGKLIGDIRKRWATACRAIGLEGQIVHDLRRSGVKHLIDSGVDPHTTMAFSGHRTPSMLRRYHIAVSHHRPGRPPRCAPRTTAGRERPLPQSGREQPHFSHTTGKKPRDGAP